MTGLALTAGFLAMLRLQNGAADRSASPGGAAPDQTLKSFLAGFGSHFFSPVFSVVSGGIGTILVVLVAALVSRQLRKLGLLHEVRPMEPDRAPKTAASMSGETGTDMTSR